MRASGLAICAVLLLVACGSSKKDNVSNGLPSGPVVLDQSSGGGTSYTVIGCPGCYEWHAQTFTVGTAGLLRRLVLHHVLRSASHSGTDPLVVEIRGVTGGEPDDDPGALYATLQVQDADLPDSGMLNAIDLDLASFGILVTPGQMLCFLLRSNGSEVGVGQSATDVYASGQLLKGSSSITGWTPTVWDLGFATYVQTP